MPKIQDDIFEKFFADLEKTEALKPEMPLEFFCCLAGTVEHEAVLRLGVLES